MTDTIFGIPIHYTRKPYSDIFFLDLETAVNGLGDNGDMICPQCSTTDGAIFLVYYQKAWRYYCPPCLRVTDVMRVPGTSGATINRPYTCDKCPAGAESLYVLSANGKTQTLCLDCLQREIAKLKRRQPGPSETK